MKEQIIKVYERYCARLDKFLYIQSFHEAEEIFKAILGDASGIYNNRNSYIDFVAKICIQEYSQEVQPHVDVLIHKQKYAEIGKLKEALYSICIEVNPGMLIDKHCRLMQRAIVTMRQETEHKKTGSLKYGDESEQILDLEKRLKQRLIGQDDAVFKLVQALKRYVAGLKPLYKPIASFMFLGNTGTGKTEMAKTLSLKYFGSESNLVRIDCSEFIASHEYAKLVGSPPGYVGYSQGSFLSKAMKEKPNCVLLFDEIEKANESVHKLILQILDEGKLRDGRGQEIIFNKAIIIMTSNLGSQELMKYQSRIGFNKNNDEVGVESICLSALQKKFSPEFINRINEIIIFKSLSRESLLQIFDVLFDEYELFLMDQNIDVVMHDSAAEFVVDQSSCELYGARELQRVMDRYIINPLADMIVKGKIFPGDEVEIFCKNEKIAFKAPKCENK